MYSMSTLPILKISESLVVSYESGVQTLRPSASKKSLNPAAVRQPSKIGITRYNFVRQKEEQAHKQRSYGVRVSNLEFFISQFGDRKTIRSIYLNRKQTKHKSQTSRDIPQKFGETISTRYKLEGGFVKKISPQPMRAPAFPVVKLVKPFTPGLLWSPLPKSSGSA